jgi:hypothetical protein
MAEADRLRMMLGTFNAALRRHTVIARPPTMPMRPDENPAIKPAIASANEWTSRFLAP